MANYSQGIHMSMINEGWFTGGRTPINPCRLRLMVRYCVHRSALAGVCPAAHSGWWKKVMKNLKTILLVLASILFFSSRHVAAAQLMTGARADKTAIVLTAFGTSTKARITYDALEAEIRKAFPGHEVRWAFTSEIIRERVNARAAREGRAERLSSLLQVLADLEAVGYRKVAVQPIHIFPGEEYEEVLSIVRNFPGLRIEVGETLMQRWEVMYRLVKALSGDFLKPEEGCNVIVAHGTPMTNVGSNIAYMGLDRHLRLKYLNVWLGGVDGVADREDALAAASRWPARKVRFIPFMYVAGDHIMSDVMGEEKAAWGESWKVEMEGKGFEVEALTVEVGGEKYYKGLGFMGETVEVFVNEVRRALERF